MWPRCWVYGVDLHKTVLRTFDPSRSDTADQQHRPKCNDFGQTASWSIEEAFPSSSRKLTYLSLGSNNLYDEVGIRVPLSGSRVTR